MGKKSTFNQAYEILQEAASQAMRQWPWLANRLEERDIVHEQVARWLELRTLDKYDPEKRTLRAFVFMLVRRWVYDYHAKLNREINGGNVSIFSLEAVLIGSDMLCLRDLIPSVTDNLDNKILLDQIMEAVPEKPSWYTGVSKREIVNRFKAGESKKEIAEDLTTSTDAVKQILKESFSTMRRRFSRTTAVFKDENRVKRSQKVPV